MRFVSQVASPDSKCRARRAEPAPGQVVRTPWESSRALGLGDPHSPPRGRQQYFQTGADYALCSWDTHTSHCDNLETKFYLRTCKPGIWFQDSTNSSWMEPAYNNILFFSFKATENLHINKAFNSHNKNTPLQTAKVSSRILVCLCCITFYLREHFPASL